MRYPTILTALVMLAAACASDTNTITTTAQPNIERPTVNTEPPPPLPTTTQQETETTAVSEPQTTTTYQVDCPEGFITTDDGGCLFAPEEPPAEEEAATEEPETAEEDDPARVVAEYWRHGLDTEALALIDPSEVGADEWGMRGERTGNREQIFHMFLWFHDPQGDIDAETGALSDALNIVRSKLESPSSIYRPVRYDLRWAEYPTEATITAHYPVGEIRILNARFDGRLWKTDTTVYTPSISTDADAGVAIPPGPPIRPTTPFAEPQWPDTANDLGRDCPPVEELWTGYGTPVTDQCTLDAVDTALRYAWAGPSELAQRAIRDGHILTDLFIRLDNQDEINPFLTAWVGEEGRSRITVNVRNMHWAGNWPGASMIYLHYQLVWADREMTEEERQGGIRYFTLSAEHGNDKSPELLRGEFDMAHERFYDSALMVRTADGTWRLSFRTICRYYEIQNTYEQPRFLCPDDPNPHFPDSSIYDHDIYSPKNPRYYNDPRERAPNTPHHDGGTPRDNTVYIGVPPS